eukprot:scaffold4209_cov160-Ochromonas_danica.AAC.12
MFQRAFYFLAAIFVCNAFLFNLRPFGLFRNQHSIKRDMSLFSKLSIGQSVIAEVDDVGGSFKDPQVFFRIKTDDNEVVPARMSAKTLTATERLAFQSGAVVKVSVIGEDNGSYRVTIPDRRLDGLSSVSGPQSEAKKAPKKAGTPPGALISSLKTGMPLQGTVSRTGPYEAHLDVKIFRPAKGGTFAPVLAKLDKDDITSSVRKSFQHANMGRNILPKGAQLPVFVKEVYKNSGQLTVTTDASVDKATVVAGKVEGRLHSLQRRQSRRVRRQLDKFEVGQTVSGVVQGVAPEGVLVNVDVDFPLNITALLGTRDLPEQFAIPDGMTDVHVQQLLSQDFVVGRRLSGTISKINPKPSVTAKYNLKLVLEELDPVPTDDFIITDRFDTEGESFKKQYYRKTKEAEKISDEEDEDDEEGDDYLVSEEDAHEIYDELKGEKNAMNEDDLFAWADLQDIIAEGSVSEDYVRSVMRSAGVKQGGAISFSQFFDIITNVQDKVFLDDDVPEEWIDDEADEDDEDQAERKEQKPVVEEEEEDDFGEEDSEEIIKEMYDDLRGNAKRLHVKSFKKWEDLVELLQEGVLDENQLEKFFQEAKVDGKNGITFEQFKILVDKIDEAATIFEEKKAALPSKSGDKQQKEKENAIEENESDDVRIEDDEDDDDDLSEIFASLRNKQGKVTVESFKQWEDIAELITSGELEESDLDTIIGEVLGKEVTKKNSKSLVMSLEQFEEIFDGLSSALNNSSDEEDVNEEEDDEDEKASEEHDDLDVKFIFDELKNEAGKVTAQAVLDWGDIQALITTNAVTQDQIDNLFAKVLGKQVTKKNAATITLTLSQLETFLAALDGLVDDRETTENAELEQDDVEIEESADKIFASLKDKQGKVTVEALKGWEDIVGLLQEGDLDEAGLDGIISDVLGKKVTKKNASSLTVNLAQFEEIVDAVESHVKSSIEASTAGKNNQKDDKDGQDEAAYSDEENVLRSYYDDLKDKTGKVTVKSFREWDDLAELMRDNLLKKEDIEEAIKSVLGKSVDKKSAETVRLSYEQFKQLADEIDARIADSDEEESPAVRSADSPKEANKVMEFDEEDEGQDSDAEESSLTEIFESLANKQGKVTVASIKQWDDLKQLVDEGFLTEKDVDDIVDEVIGKKVNTKNAATTVLTYDQFQQIVDEMDNRAGGEEEDEEDDQGSDDSEEEEGAPPDEEIFEELSSDGKTVKVQDFLAWDELQELQTEGYITKKDILEMVRAVGAQPKGNLTLPQFKALIRKVEELVEEEGSDEDGEDDDEDIDPEVFRADFDKLRGKNDAVSVKALDKWAPLQLALSAGAMSAETLNLMIDGVTDKKKAKTLTFDEFAQLAGLVQQISASSEEDGSEAAVQKEIDSFLDTSFDELKGSKNSVSLDRFREWEEIQDLLKSGALKASALEKTLLKVVGPDGESMSRSQFKEVFELLQKFVDMSNFDFASLEKELQAAEARRNTPVKKEKEEKTKKEATVAKPSAQVLTFDDEVAEDVSGDDENDSIQEEEEDDGSNGLLEEMTPEEAAREIFDELAAKSGKKKLVRLADFIAWEEVQDLLQSGSLTKDDLSKAISNSGVDIDDQKARNLEDCTMDFDTIIENFIDKEKLQELQDIILEKKVDVNMHDPQQRTQALAHVNTLENQLDKALDNDSNEPADVKVSYTDSRGDKKAEAMEALRALHDELVEMEDSLETSDKEVEDMFKSLSRGKGYITEKALRNWDELKALMDSGIVSKKMVSDFIEQIDVKDGRLSLDNFRQFMDLLDSVFSEGFDEDDVDEDELADKEIDGKKK